MDDESNEQANKKRNTKLEREKRREFCSFACKSEIFYNLYNS